MQVDTQTYLRLVEDSGRLCFFDIEATGLAGDYNSVLVTSIKPWGSDEITTFCVDRPGEDKQVIRDTIKELDKYDCWCTFYGKGFDVPMLQARALGNRLSPLIKKHHIDLFFQLSSHVKTSRRSQAHFLRWLGTPEKKMDMSPSEWNKVLANPTQALPRMVKRCESDVKGLNGLYNRVKHLIGNVTR